MKGFLVFMHNVAIHAVLSIDIDLELVIAQNSRAIGKPFDSPVVPELLAQGTMDVEPHASLV